MGVLRGASGTGFGFRRLVAVAVVPVFGVAAALVPVSASAASRAATSVTTAAVASAQAAPAAASSNFWSYETIQRRSTISQDNDYDFSAKMTHEMEKVTRKALEDRVKDVGKWIALLATAINAFVHNHPHAVAIAGFIAAVIAVLNIKKVAALWKWLKGIIYTGKHRRSSVDKSGFWATVFSAETDPPNSYAGWHARSCSTDKVTCGSPADHHKEYWP